MSRAQVDIDQVSGLITALAAASAAAVAAGSTISVPVYVNDVFHGNATMNAGVYNFSPPMLFTHVVEQTQVTGGANVIGAQRVYISAYSNGQQAVSGSLDLGSHNPGTNVQFYLVRVEKLFGTCINVYTGFGDVTIGG